MSSVDSNATILPSPLIDGLMLMPSSVVFVMRRRFDCVWARFKLIRHSAAVQTRTSASSVKRRTGGCLDLNRNARSAAFSRSLLVRSGSLEALFRVRTRAFYRLLVQIQRIFVGMRGVTELRFWTT